MCTSLSVPEWGVNSYYKRVYTIKHENTGNRCGYRDPGHNAI